MAARQGWKARSHAPAPAAEATDGDATPADATPVRGRRSTSSSPPTTPGATPQFHGGGHGEANHSVGRVRTLSRVNQIPVRAEFKVVLVGSSNAGKTCIAHSYIRGTFNALAAPTVGAGYNTQIETVPVNGTDGENCSVKIALWDTAGQEQFADLVPLYFRDAHAVILVADCSRRDALEDLGRWIEKVRTAAPDDSFRLLALSKIDVEDGERWVSTHEAMDFAKAEGLHFTEVSAKDNKGVRPMFRNIAERCWRKHLQEEARKASDTAGAVSVAAKKNQAANSKRKRCC